MPNKADVKAWKAQLVAQAEQQILKLTDSDRFKQYLNTLAKFHHYSARNIDLIMRKILKLLKSPVLSNGRRLLTAPSTGAQKRFGLRPRLLRS